MQNALYPQRPNRAPHAHVDYDLDGIPILIPFTINRLSASLRLFIRQTRPEISPLGSITVPFSA